MADKALPYASHCSSSNLLSGIPTVWRLDCLVYGVGVAIIGSGEEEESMSGLLSLSDGEGIVPTLGDRVYKPVDVPLIRAFPFSACVGVVKRVFSSSSSSSYTLASNGGR
jgi:hypothetical protein